MFEIGLFNARFFFRIDYQHFYANSFVFGTDLSSVEQYYLVSNGDEDGDPESKVFQEYSWNIWLGLISFHIGHRGKTNNPID